MSSELRGSTAAMSRTAPVPFDVRLSESVFAVLSPHDS